MKAKTLLSSFILAAFLILGGGSFDGAGKVLAVAAIGFVLLVVVGVVQGNQKEKERREQSERERLQREQKLKAQAEEYDAQRRQFTDTHGQPDKSVVLRPLDFGSEIHVYEKARKLFIMGREYAFRDVISCTYSDSPRVVKGKVTAVTQTKSGSMIGRSIVGNVVAGPAGAVIGGTTAKRQTEFTQGEDKTVHDYTVIINMNSIAQPVIRIHTGQDGRLTNEIVGLMNVVISRR